MPNAEMLIGNHEYMMLNAIGHCKDAVEEKENGKTWTRTVYRGAKVVFQRRKCCILVNLRKKTEREPLFSLSKTVPDKLFIRETVDTRGLKA